MDGWYPNDLEISVAWSFKALPLRLELRLRDLRKRASVQSEAVKLTEGVLPKTKGLMEKWLI